MEIKKKYWEKLGFLLMISRKQIKGNWIKFESKKLVS